MKSVSSLGNLAKHSRCGGAYKPGPSKGHHREYTGGLGFRDREYTGVIWGSLVIGIHGDK